MPHNDLHFEGEEKDELDIKPTGFLEPIPDLTLYPQILPEHFHEADRIDFRFLRNRKLYIHHTIYGADAATAGNYGVFWIAPFECTVTEVREVHQTASTSGTLQIEKLTGTQALGGGVNVLNATISLSATADTVVTGTLSTVPADIRLVRGNRLAMEVAGTLTSGVNVTVVIEITIL